MAIVINKLPTTCLGGAIKMIHRHWTVSDVNQYNITDNNNIAYVVKNEALVLTDIPTGVSKTVEGHMLWSNRAGKKLLAFKVGDINQAVVSLLDAEEEFALQEETSSSPSICPQVLEMFEQVKAEYDKCIRLEELMFPPIVKKYRLVYDEFHHQLWFGKYQFSVGETKRGFLKTDIAQAMKRYLKYQQRRVY